MIVAPAPDLAGQPRCELVRRLPGHNRGTLILQDWYPAATVCSGNTCTLALTSDLAPGGYLWYAGAHGVGEGQGSREACPTPKCN